jgi:O-antigen/teichoic acid export membrane protein
MQIRIVDGRGFASIARNLFYLLAGRGVYFITRFFYAIVMARVLGPQIYGTVSYGIGWYLLFLPLTKMGLEIVLSRDVGRCRQTGEHSAALALTLRSVFIIAATTAYLICSAFFEHDPALRLMIFILGFALVGRSAALWAENVYTAYEVNHYAFRQQSIFRPLEVALGLLVLFIWRAALPVVIVHCLVWCLEGAYGLILVHRRVFPLRLNRHFSDLRRFFLQGIPLGAAILMLALPYQGPLIFFRHISSAGDSLGHLALAMQVFFIFSHFPIAFASVSLPVLSRSAMREDGKDRLFAETSIRLSLLFGSFLSLVGTAMGPWLTVQIFSERYAQAGMLIGPVLWLMIPSAVNQTLFRVLMAHKRDGQVLFSALAGALVFSLIISEAVVHYGATGAIWSAAMAMSLTTVCLIVFLHKLLEIDVLLSLIKPGLTVLLAGGVFLALSFAGPMFSLLGAFVSLAIFSWLTGCLTHQDTNWLKLVFGWIAKMASIDKSKTGSSQ